MLTCPEWKDRDEHRAGKCFEGVEAVVKRACELSLKRRPDRVALRAWHRDAFSGVVPLAYYAGNFRRLDRKYPCLAAYAHVGGQSGAPPERVEALMREFDDWLGAELATLEARGPVVSDDESALLVADIVGTAIARFVHIHPFMNGNGRTSRMLWKVLLHRLGFQPPAFSVVHRPAEPGYAAAMSAAMRNDYAPSVRLVLRALSRGPRTPAEAVGHDGDDA